MGLHHLLPVHLDTEARLGGQVDAAAHDLHGFLGEPFTALLPDPVGVDAVHFAGDGGGALHHHGKGNVKVVVGVAAPHQAEVIAQLAHPDRAFHGPEMGVRQRNVHALQGQGVAHLPPVGVDHVGGGGHHGGLAELRHHLAAGEALLGAAGVLHVGKHFFQVGGHLQRLLQTPAAVGVQVHAGVGEGLLDGGDCLDLLLGSQHAALELEVLKAVLFVGGLGQRHDGLRGQRLLVAHTVPVAVGIRLRLVLQIGLVAVAHIEQVGEEPHPLPLDAVPHQGGGRNVQQLAHQVQQRGLDGGDHMHAGAQVKGLQTALVVLDVGAQPGADFIQRGLVVHHAGTQHQMLHILEGFGDFLAAGHLAHALGALGIRQDDDVAGEVGRVRAGQVQLHAVVTGHREHFHFSDNRRVFHLRFLLR